MRNEVTVKEMSHQLVIEDLSWHHIINYSICVNILVRQISEKLPMRFGTFSKFEKRKHVEFASLDFHTY